MTINIDTPSTDDDYVVEALWNAQANLWSARCTDIPSLFAEEETLEELIAAVMRVMPRPLSARNGGEIRVRVVARSRGRTPE